MSPITPPPPPTTTSSTLPTSAPHNMEDGSQPVIPQPVIEVFAIHGAEPEVQAYAMAKYSRSALSMKESLREISARHGAVTRSAERGENLSVDGHKGETSAFKIQRDIHRARGMRQRAYGNIVDTGLRDGMNRGQIHTAARLGFRATANPRHRQPKLHEIHVIQQNDIGAGGDGVVHLIKRVGFHPGRPAPSTGGSSGLSQTDGQLPQGDY